MNHPPNLYTKLEQIMFSLHFLCAFLLFLRCLGGCSEDSDCNPRSCFTVTCKLGECDYDRCSYPTPFCGDTGCVACRVDSHCDENEFCHENGDCVKDSSDESSTSTPECDSNRHCSDTDTPYCLDGICVDCLRDSDCKLRHCYSVVCVNGGCEYEPCTDPTPFCGDNGCIACRVDAHCDDDQVCYPTGLCVTPIVPTPVLELCDSDDECYDVTQPYCLKGLCVACKSQLDCSGSTPGCDTETGTCIACRANKDCLPSLPVCAPTGECTKCIQHGDCLAATPYCNTVSGSCVECLKGDDCLAFDTCTPTSCLADHKCVGTEASSCIGEDEICSDKECVVQIPVTIAGPKQGILTFTPGNEFQGGFSIHAPSGTVLRLHRSRANLQGTCECDGTDTNCVPGGIGIACSSAFETVQLSFPEDDLWLPSVDPADVKSCFITCQVPENLCSADPLKGAGGSVFVVDSTAEPCIFGIDLQLAQGVPNTPVLIKAHYGPSCGGPWGEAETFSF